DPGEGIDKADKDHVVAKDGKIVEAFDEHIAQIGEGNSPDLWRRKAAVNIGVNKRTTKRAQSLACLRDLHRAPFGGVSDPHWKVLPNFLFEESRRLRQTQELFGRDLRTRWTLS